MVVMGGSGGGSDGGDDDGGVGGGDGGSDCGAGDGVDGATNIIRNTVEEISFERCRSAGLRIRNNIHD